MNLDTPAEFGRVDTADALADVESTAQQWAAARSAGVAGVDLQPYDTVVVSGMGGSGITGDIAWALSLEAFERPLVVHKGYGVPVFTDERTLVVALSHSGNTEETLSAFEAAGQRGAGRLVVTTGGALADRAAAEGAQLVVVPGGARPPRHSLGVMLVPTLIALGLDKGLDEAIDVLTAVAGEQGRDVASSGNAAKQVAQRLAEGAIALAWGGRGLGAVAAYRLKCQLNENAKVPALHAELPEANHNDVVGWEGHSRLAGAGGIVAFRDAAGEHPRVARRFDLTLELLRDRVAWTAQVTARGTSRLARLASLLLQADLVSIYTALALDTDPTPIAAIDELKARLGAPAAAR